MLEFLYAILLFSGFVALMGAVHQLRIRSLRRVSRKHGYAYSEDDHAAGVRACPLVGAGTFSHFVSGERGRKFVICHWKWTTGTMSSRDRERHSRISAVVLVELRRPVPSLMIRPFGQNLPLEWRPAGPGLGSPPSRISTRRFHIRRPDDDGVLCDLPRRLAAVMGGLKIRALATDGGTMAWTSLTAPKWPGQVERLLDEAMVAAEALEEEGETVVAALPASPPPASAAGTAKPSFG